MPRDPRAFEADFFFGFALEPLAFFFDEVLFRFGLYFSSPQDEEEEEDDDDADDESESYDEHDDESESESESDDDVYLKFIRGNASSGSDSASGYLL